MRMMSSSVGSGFAVAFGLSGFRCGIPVGAHASSWIPNGGKLGRAGVSGDFGFAGPCLPTPEPPNGRTRRWLICSTRHLAQGGIAFPARFSGWGAPIATGGPIPRTARIIRDATPKKNVGCLPAELPRSVAASLEFRPLRRRWGHAREIATTVRRRRNWAWWMRSCPIPKSTCADLRHAPLRARPALVRGTRGNRGPHPRRERAVPSPEQLRTWRRTTTISTFESPAPRGNTPTAALMIPSMRVVHKGFPDAPIPTGHRRAEVPNLEGRCSPRRLRRPTPWENDRANVAPPGLQYAFDGIVGPPITMGGLSLGNGRA